MTPRQTEMGLTQRTRNILANPPPPEPAPIRQIGPSQFLRHYTEPNVWQTFAEIGRQARHLDPMLNERTLQITLCELERRGVFKKKPAPTGKRKMLYCRPVKELPAPSPIEARVVSIRKITARNSW